MCDIDYDTIQEDPRVTALIIQFLALRSLDGKELDDMKRLVSIYFPTLEHFRNINKKSWIYC